MDDRQSADIRQISDDLFLISLFPPIPGFSSFVSAWLYTGDPCFLVDIGPSATTPQLIHALKHLKVAELDTILLTHIHIDHAGGAGDLIQAFPDARIVVHPDGIPHLIDPSRLWKGSLAVLGEIARAYQPIRPVPADRLIDTRSFSAHGIIPIHTPGHSANHVSYQFQDMLFIGEAGGVNLSAVAGEEYSRPATPPRFFREVFLQSLETLIRRNVDFLCYGHWGAADNGVERLNMHRDQLLLWNRIIGEEMQNRKPESLVAGCMNRLLAEDRLLQGFHRLDADTRKREEYFIGNGIKGISQYLETAADNPQSV